MGSRKTPSRCTGFSGKSIDDLMFLHSFSLFISIIYGLLLVQSIPSNVISKMSSQNTASTPEVMSQFYTKQKLMLVHYWVQHHGYCQLCSLFGYFDELAQQWDKWVELVVKDRVECLALEVRRLELSRRMSAHHSSMNQDLSNKDTKNSIEMI